jgi:hypothetical protein
MVGHASLLHPKIGISGCSIYVIEQSLLLVFEVYGEFPPIQSVTGFAYAEFGQEDLMLDQFGRRHSDVHVFVGVLS